MDEETINLAYAEYRLRRKMLFDTSQEVVDAKIALETKKNWAVNNNMIDGKNETERKGQLAEATKVEMFALDIAERKYSEVQFFFDLASYGVAHAKLLVQFLSLSQGE